MPRRNQPRHDPRHAPLTLAAGSIDVAFAWSGDRWTHRVLLHGETAWESVDGPTQPDGDPRWPASPVLVELDRVGRGPAAAVVAVGLAGRSHFSASFSRVPAATAAGFDVLVEIACRVQEPPAWLGSSYAARTASAPMRAEGLLLLPVAGCLLAAASAGLPDHPTAVVRRLQAVVAAGSGPFAGPATIGWSYRIGQAGMAGAGPA